MSLFTWSRKAWGQSCRYLRCAASLGARGVAIYGVPQGPVARIVAINGVPQALGARGVAINGVPRAPVAPIVGIYRVPQALALLHRQVLLARCPSPCFVRRLAGRFARPARPPHNQCHWPRHQTLLLRPYLPPFRQLFCWSALGVPFLYNHHSQKRNAHPSKCCRAIW